MCPEDHLYVCATSSLIFKDTPRFAKQKYNIRDFIKKSKTTIQIRISCAQFANFPELMVLFNYLKENGVQWRGGGFSIMSFFGLNLLVQKVFSIQGQIDYTWIHSHLSLSQAQNQQDLCPDVPFSVPSPGLLGS